MILRLFILSGLLYCSVLYSQTCTEEIYNVIHANPEDLLNGTKWNYEKKYMGSPMLVEKYWPKAELVYNGIPYPDIIMNFDVYNNEIIIYHPEKDRDKYVVISNEKLSQFSFTDTVAKRKHLYKLIELPGTGGMAWYENNTFNKTILYIKPLKRIASGSSGKTEGEFSDYSEFYLVSGNSCNMFHSKKQLLELLATHDKELKRFIRKNRLKIYTANPENIISILRYFDTLN